MFEIYKTIKYGIMFPYARSGGMVSGLMQLHRICENDGYGYA